MSESLARAFLPGGSALGRRIRLIGMDAEAEWRTVVGVVRDVAGGNPLTNERNAMSIYVPLPQTPVSAVWVMVKHRGDDQGAQALLRQAMADQDAYLVPDRILSYEEVFGSFTMVTTATVKMFLGCFVFALVLAATGIYGLTARSVSQRTREIGVRRALGATDYRVVRWLMREGGTQLGIGMLVTAPAFVAVSVALSQLLALQISIFVLSATGVAVIVCAVVLVATYVPSRRAVALEPSRVLWQE